MSYEDYIPKDLKDLYQIFESNHAAAVLANEFKTEFNEICLALRKFRFTKHDVTAPGGSESNIPKKITSILRPLGWNEEKLNASIVANGQIVKYDTHKVDFIKGRVAFDVEWNSKDQTYDRDLFAFRTFFDYSQISAGVLLTRSEELNDLFRKWNVLKKYGASTTHMGKLISRIQAGRNGGCPILVFGITKNLLTNE